MGSVSSTCKRRKRSKIITVIHDNYTQPANTLPCVTNGSSHRCHHYLSSRQHIQRPSNSPLHSTPFNKPSGIKNNISSYRPNPYVAHRIEFPRVSNIDHNTSRHQHRTLPRINKSFSTIDTSEHWINRQNVGDRSIPIDMFLIDISNEHVPIGQPVSMHIRHLLLKAPDHNYTKPSASARTRPVSMTTHSKENLLHYISNVCKKYPNFIVDSNQRTHNTLHARLPSQFSHTVT